MRYDANVNVIPMFFSLAICGVIVAFIGGPYGPKATLAMSLGTVLLGCMLAAVGAASGEQAVTWVASGALMAGVLGVFACAANKWLPKG